MTPEVSAVADDAAAEVIGDCSETAPEIRQLVLDDPIEAQHLGVCHRLVAVCVHMAALRMASAFEPFGQRDTA
jgi:hypothetical protein